MRSNLAIALMLFMTCVASEEFMFVLEVSRHGAREASKMFNFTKDPSANFNSTSNLTPFGKKQHFLLG